MESFRRVLPPITDGARGFTLTVYPTRDYRDAFLTRFPVIATASVVAIIVGIAGFVTLVEGISERMVRKQPRKNAAFTEAGGECAD